MAKKSKSEDERDNFIARMQAEKAAELQAKLAMVEMRDKPSYGRSTIVELFRGKPEDIAGKLDAASGLPLLTDGAKS